MGRLSAARRALPVDAVFVDIALCKAFNFEAKGQEEQRQPAMPRGDTTTAPKTTKTPRATTRPQLTIHISYVYRTYPW